MSNDELDGNFAMYDGDIPQLQPHVQNYDANAQQDGARKRLQIARNLWLWLWIIWMTLFWFNDAILIIY